MTISRYKAIDLSRIPIGLDRVGTARPLPASAGPPPTIDGLTVGAALLSSDAPHHGEMHPDGDELLYLTSGRVDVVLEEDGGEVRVELKPGQAFVVPRGVWHRVAVREPSQILYMTPGPGGQYRPLDGGSPRDVRDGEHGPANRPAPAPPTCDQLNLVVRDMEATLAFYRRLGLSIPDGPRDWPPGSGARHTEVAMPGGFRLEFDNREMTSIWHTAFRGEEGGESTSVVTFSLPSREAVDALHAHLTAVGYASRHAPHDAFWGSRFAIIQDPDGRDVGLMSPPDAARRFVPAA
jgi:catechol 2,3-dioxygenase-like lactoylglutathione lyase family enzyme